MNSLMIIRIFLLVLSIATFVPVLSSEGGFQKIFDILTFVLPLYIPTFIFLGISFYFTNPYLIIIPSIAAFAIQAMIVYSVLNSTNSTAAIGYLAIPVLSLIAYVVIGGIIYLILRIKGKNV